MNRTSIEEKTAFYLNTFLGKDGYILLKTEYVKEDGINYLRAYIDLSDEEKLKRKKQIEELQSFKETEAAKYVTEDREGKTDTEAADDTEKEEIPAEPGIGINDCANVSRRLSKWLDKEDFIPDEYMLEVCSKGYLKENEE